MDNIGTMRIIDIYIVEFIDNIFFAHTEFRHFTEYGVILTCQMVDWRFISKNTGKIVSK